MDITEKQKEFERETVPHMDILYNYALRTTGDADDAKDLLQETYMKAFRFWNQFEKGTNLRAWLFRIMKNSYINQYRKEKSQGNAVSYDDVEEFVETLRDETHESHSSQDKIFDNILGDEVTTALESLPDDFRTVVILCDIEGLPYEEIAEFIQIPIGTVRSRLHRGRKMLQKKLKTYAQQKGFALNE